MLPVKEHFWFQSHCWGTLPAAHWLGAPPASLRLRHIPLRFEMILRVPPPGGNPDLQPQKCFSLQRILHVELYFIRLKEGAKEGTRGPGVVTAYSMGTCSFPRTHWLDCLAPQGLAWVGYKQTALPPAKGCPTLSGEHHWPYHPEGSLELWGGEMARSAGGISCKGDRPRGWSCAGQCHSQRKTLPKGTSPTAQASSAGRCGFESHSTLEKHDLQPDLFSLIQYWSCRPVQMIQGDSSQSTKNWIQSVFWQFSSNLNRASLK